MKTDNKTTNKTEYAEMVRGSIDSRILSEAANHTFEKRRSPASTWAAAACFTLIFAAATIFLFKPKTERGQASKVTASPEATKTAQTTPDACFTPVPTPDISNMRIIYGRADCIAINDVQHKPGTVTLYGGLREMLADEQYQNCVFAVDIDIQDSYPYSYLYDDPSEESDRLYAEFQNDPAVVRYNGLYEQFVQENADRYDEFLARYHPSLSSFHSGYPTRDVKASVFSSAFRNHLTSTGQEQILYDYGKAERKYYSKLSQARNEAEVQRLRSLGLIVEEYKAYEHPLDSSLSSVYIEPECRIYPNMRLRCLLTRDQLLNFPASPEFAYIITPAVNGDDTPEPTPDIGNMRIIYGSGDVYGIDDIVHEPGTVTLYGGLTEKLADEQYNNCIFAVHIDIQDYYLSDKHSEEGDRLYAEFQNDPAVVRYNELYESFVRENADRYGEFLETYYYPSEFHGDFDSREKELEAIAEKYDETMVFPTAFRDHLISTGQEQILKDYAEAEDEYFKKRSELWQDWENRPEEKNLHKARHDAEVERLKDCGLISKEYVYDGKTMFYWLLTRDQLLNFPASPEFAYIVTPVNKGEFSCIATEVPQTWYAAADEKEELVIDFFRCIDEERFDDLAKLIAPEERAGYEAIAALAEGSRVGVRNISSVIVTEMNPYELTDDMVFAKSLEKYVGIDGARSAYRVKLDMNVYDNTGAFADETGETDQIVLLVKNAEEWFVGFLCLIND